MEAKRKMDELKKILAAKLEKEGWDSIRQFTMRSRIPLSQETTRRAFGESDKPLEPASVAVIARYLGFSPEEIKGFLRDYTEDDDLWQMIGREDTRYTVTDLAVLEAFKTLAEHGTPATLKSLADHMDLLAKTIEVDIREHTDKLRRRLS